MDQGHQSPAKTMAGFVRVIPSWLGMLWLIGGAVGIAGTVVGAIVAMSTISDVTAASIDAIVLSQSVFEAVDETGLVLDQTFSEVAIGLDTVQGTVADASATMDRMATVTNDLTVLLTETVPESLDAVHDTMPQLIRTAGVIDGAMRALRFVGVDYDPDAPLDDSLVELDSRIAVIPEELRGQRDSLTEVSQGITEFASQSRTIAADVGSIRDGLRDSRTVVDGYRRTADRASRLASDLEERLVSQVTIGRWVIVALAIGLITAQTLPLAAGWWIVRGGEATSTPVVE